MARTAAVPKRPATSYSKGENLQTAITESFMQYKSTDEGEIMETDDKIHLVFKKLFAVIK